MNPQKLMSHTLKHYLHTHANYVCMAGGGGGIKTHALDPILYFLNKLFDKDGHAKIPEVYLLYIAVAQWLKDSTISNLQRISTLTLLHSSILTVWEDFISLCYQLEHLVSFFNIVLVLVRMPFQCQLTVPKGTLIEYERQWYRYLSCSRDHWWEIEICQNTSEMWTHSLAGPDV